MTEEDLLHCTMREEAHFNGGKAWFGWMHRCIQHPRLTRMDKYIRSDRRVESTFRVDGKPVSGLAEAADRLGSPYQPTADDLTLLALVPDEFARLENRSRFLPLRDCGLVEFRDGDCRRTEAGRAALQEGAS